MRGKFFQLVSGYREISVMLGGKEKAYEKLDRPKHCKEMKWLSRDFFKKIKNQNN